MLDKIKRLILKLFWPYGSVANIKMGPLKGYQFIISDNSGWSPIVGRWEPECQTLFSKIIKPGYTIFDLGANNGIHSLLFSKLTGIKGRVFAFEPLKSNVDEIKKNYTLNNLKNIEVIPKAVGSENCEVTFKLGLHNKQGSILGIGRESGKELKVPMTTLASFVREYNVKPDFIKIDIEGAESEALKGMGDIIWKLQPVLFIELHTPEQDEKVGIILSDNNYDAYRLQMGASSKSKIENILSKIERLDLPYPAPNGIWGSIVAIHSSKSPF